MTSTATIGYVGVMHGEYASVASAHYVVGNTRPA